jgi:hypothetical protein
MIRNHRRFFHANCLLFTLVAVWGAWSCAAPDAQPSPEKPNNLPDATDSDASDASETPLEPIAGDPTWRVGFGEATNDQKLFDIAFDPISNSIVSTLGYITAITIPGVNGEMPFLSGLDPAVSITVQNILVVKQDPVSHAATWAVPIRAGAEIVRSTVDVDVQGNVIVAGGFIGQLEIGALTANAAGSYDAYVAKFDPAGQPLWLRRFGAVAEDYITDVAVDGDGNIVVVGFAASSSFDFGNNNAPPNVTSKDLFIAKFDGMGNVLWAQRPGAAGATDILGNNNWREPTATVEVSRVDGSIVMGGIHGGSLNFPPLPVPAVATEDGFVVKLDKDGTGLWQLAFGSLNSKQRVRSVSIGTDGDVALVGSFQGNVMVGTETLTSFKGTEDLLVAKLDDKGVPRWVKHFGSLGDQWGTKVLLDEKGRLFVGGSFTGSIDFFGGGALTNTTKEMPYTPTDIFVAKFKEDGTALWAHAWGDADPKALVGIQTIEGGVFWKNDKAEPFVFFGGINSGLIDFDGKVQFLKSTGFEDAYLMSITY